mgnify:CR=1 FL=1
MELSNHPADQLVEIKQEIKALKLKENHLKGCLMEMREDERMGQFYEARVTQRIQRRLSRDLLLEKVERCVFEDCLIESSTDFLTLSKIKK